MLRFAWSFRCLGVLMFGLTMVGLLGTCKKKSSRLLKRIQTVEDCFFSVAAAWGEV